jgi:putative sterol carrier protein
LPEERAVYLDLFQGDCREARTATAADLAAVPYVIAADPSTWKRVLERELEPLTGLMRGKLRLAKGSVASLIPYLSAAKEMVLSATRIETLFPEALV